MRALARVNWVSASRSRERPMRRREAILAISVSLLPRAAARAEAPEGAARVGVLMGNAASDPDARRRVDAFLRQLGELGWAIDRNLRVDLRFAAVIGDDTSSVADLSAAFGVERRNVEHDVHGLALAEHEQGAAFRLHRLVADEVRRRQTARRR